MKTLISRLAQDERIRFLVTGGINTLVGYLLFAAIQLLLGKYIGYVGSLLMSHIIASTLAFNLYRRVVFRVRGNALLDFLRFQTVYIVPVLFNVIALPFLVEVLGWNVYMAQALVMIVSTTVSYLGHKFFSFRRKAGTADLPAQSLTWSDVLDSEGLIYAATLALTAVATTVSLALWRADWRVPFAYVGDAVGTAAQIKTTLQRGWYESQVLLNAPHGQVLHDFSTADHLGLLFAKVANLFTTDYAVIMNVIYVLGFLLAGLTAAWFLRLVGVSRVFTVVLAVLYAIAPYHFYRGEVHLWLSGYFCIPLGMGLVYRAIRGQRLWGARSDREGWASILTAPTTVTLVIAAVVGTTSTYYGVFTIVLLVLAAGVQWLSTFDWRRLVGAAIATLAVGFFMLINMLPDMAYEWAHGANTAALVRPPGGTEFYSLKFAALVLPVPGDRIGILAAAREYYDALFPLTGEDPALGFVAAVGFIALLGLAIFYAAGVRRQRSVTPTASALRSLSALTVLGFLLATVGGLASIIGLITTSLRGWNRMSIVLALFALAAVGLILGALITRVTKRFSLANVARAIVAAILALGLLGVGFVDQVTAAATPDYAANKAAYDDDQALVDGIAAEVGPTAMIMQLPYREYPESASAVGIADTDQLKFFLHSDTLSWSSGGIKGRPDAEWVKYAQLLPTDQLVSAAAAAGFGGILVDTLALTEPVPAPTDDNPTATEPPTRDVAAELADVLGEPKITGSGRRYEFFSLASADEANAAILNSSEEREIADAVVSPVTAAFEPDNLGTLSGIDLLKPFRPRLFLQNARDSSVRVDIAFTLKYLIGPATIRFTYQDGTTHDFRVTDKSRTLDIPLDVVPGRSYVDVRLVEGPAWPSRIGAVFDPISIAVTDVELHSLLNRLEPAESE